MEPEQNGGHFANDLFRSVFLYENVWISIKIPRRCVPVGAIDSKLSLIQVMAWHRTGAKPLPLPMINTVHWRLYASPGFNELKLLHSVFIILHKHKKWLWKRFIKEMSIYYLKNVHSSNSAKKIVKYQHESFGYNIERNILEIQAEK